MIDSHSLDPRSAGRGRAAALVLTAVLALVSLVCIAAFAETASRAPASPTANPPATPPAPPATPPDGSPAPTGADGSVTPETEPDEVTEDAEEAAEEQKAENESQDSAVPVTKFLRTNNFTVPRKRTVEGDRFVGCNQTDVEGTVDGDFFVLTNDASISGRVTGDFSAISQYIDISGTAEDDVRTMSNDLSVRGRIGGDLIAMAKDVTISKDARIEGRTMLFASRATLDGDFTQRVSVIGGEITFRGHARGNVKIETDQLIFADGARIDGNLVYSASHELESARAKRIVGGKVIFIPEEKVDKKATPFLARVVGQIWSFLASFLIGCGLILVARRLVRTILETARTEALMSFGFGMLGHILVPFVALLVVVACLCLGFIVLVTWGGRLPPFPFAFVPVGLLILTVWAVLFYLAKFVVSAAFGDTLLRRFGYEPSPYVALLVGMVPVWILINVPKLGSFLDFIIVPMFGIGVILVGLRAHFVRRGALVPAAIVPAA